MCRMLGVVFRGDFPADVLGSLKALSKIGRVPGRESPGHIDGWGIATFNNGSPVYLGRSTRPAFVDTDYDYATDAATRIGPPNILIGHVRAASQGSVAVENTHPFVVDNLVFAHNGTVKGLSKDNRGRAVGQTDSELVAILLADRMREKKSLVAAMKSVITENIDNLESTASILLASDGKTLVGFRDYSDPGLAWYYSLKVAECADSVVVFQEIEVGCEGESSEVRKRELIAANLELEVTSQIL